MNPFAITHICLFWRKNTFLKNSLLLYVLVKFLLKKVSVKAKSQVKYKIDSFSFILHSISFSLCYQRRVPSLRLKSSRRITYGLPGRSEYQHFKGCQLSPSGRGVEASTNTSGNLCYQSRRTCSLSSTELQCVLGVFGVTVRTWGTERWRVTVRTCSELQRAQCVCAEL